MWIVKASLNNYTVLQTLLYIEPLELSTHNPLWNYLRHYLSGPPSVWLSLDNEHNAKSYKQIMSNFTGSLK